MMLFAAIAYIISIVGCVIGTLLVVNMFMTPGISAPQEAAGAALAVAITVIPYCFARAVEKIGSIQYHVEAASSLRALKDATEVHTRLLAAIANTISTGEEKSPQ